MMTILYQFTKYRNSSNIFSDGRISMLYHRTIEIKYYIITILYNNKNYFIILFDDFLVLAFFSKAVVLLVFKALNLFFTSILLLLVLISNNFDEFFDLADILFNLLSIFISFAFAAK